MISFPLLSLPYLAVKEIVLQLDPANVIELTMKSQRFKYALEFFKLSPRSFHWIVRNSGVDVKLGFPDCDIDFTLNSNFKLSNNCQVEGRSLVFARSAQGCDHKFELNFPSNKEGNSEELTRFLLSILRPRVFHVQFSSDIASSIKNYFIWSYQKKFGLVKVIKTELCPEDLKFLIEDVDSSHLSLCVKVTNFIYQESIKRDQVTLTNLSWVRNDLLRKMDSKTVVIEAQNDPGINYNKLIDNWICGGTDSLQFFRVNFNEPLRQSIVEMFQGINHKSSIFTAKDLRNRNVQTRNQNPVMVDIRRGQDDRLATVVVDLKSFHLVVWQKKDFLWCTPETRFKLKTLG